MFKIAQDLSSMACAANESIAFTFQPCSSLGVPEDLTGRAFVFTLYDGKRLEIAAFDGQLIANDDGSSSVLWVIPGEDSEALYEANPTLTWDLTEREHEGQDQIATGTFNVAVSAPGVADLPTAPVARYVQRIRRLNDPSTLASPKFVVGMAAFTPPSITTQPALQSANFSDAENSGLAALYF